MIRQPHWSSVASLLVVAAVAFARGSLWVGTVVATAATSVALMTSLPPLATGTFLYWSSLLVNVAGMALFLIGCWQQQTAMALLGAGAHFFSIIGPAVWCALRPRAESDSTTGRLS